MISISQTTFPYGYTECSITYSGEYDCYIGSETRGIYFSLDGDRFANLITIESGTTNITVRITDSVPAGTIIDGIQWTTGFESGGWDIEVTGGNPPKYVDLGLSLAPRAATVQYSGNLVNTPNVSLGSTLTGNVLDHRYTYEVERISVQGERKAVSGAAYANALVQKLITYRVHYSYHWDGVTYGWIRPTLRDHLAAISSEIGIPIVLIGADFKPATNINIQLRRAFQLSFDELLSGSFSECLNRLIGWSDDVPGMAYRLYVDNNTIYIVQQGHEQNTVTPANWALRPTLTYTKRHTQWADSQYQTIIPKEISSGDAAESNEPFSGTITWGGTTMTYEDGYLIHEQRTNSTTQNTVTTTYTYADYNDGKRLTQKETVDVDDYSYSVTTYSYQYTEEQVYLFEEIYKQYDGQDATGELIKAELTRNVPVGGGWYGTTVYDIYDGTEEELSTSLSQGAPGQKASQYLVDAANDALKPAGTQRQMVVPLTGVAKARQTYPVADLATLQNIANALNRYEGKTEIQLQGEIVGGTHVYNYNDLITFDGNTYHIVSNNVTQTYNKIRQNITAVRWVV